MLFLLTLVLFSQNPPKPTTATPTPQPTTQAGLEQQVAVLTQTQKELQAKMEQGDSKLDLKIEKEMLKLERSVITWNALVKSSLSLLGIGLVFIGMAFWQGKKLFTKEMHRLFREEAKTLQKMLDEQNLQDKLLIETRILLLSAAETATTKAWLRHWGMTLADVQDPRSFQTAPTQHEYDLIVFDQVDQATINDIMAVYPRDYFVGYVPNARLKLDHQERINLANSPITLFTRILETARFSKRQAGQG